MSRKIMLAVCVVAVGSFLVVPAFASAPADGGGATTVNGWYGGEEIYYINGGVEQRVTQPGHLADIYVIGDVPRMYQANVVEAIPGEAGYSPHWDVNFVNTAEGVTLNDILASGYASSKFDSEGVLFDNVQDIQDAADAGLVTISTPGVVVLCPIISEKAADAPGNTQAPEDFASFPETF
jgi:hypothetical protein